MPCKCDQSNIDFCSDECLLGPQVRDDGFQKVSRLLTHLPDFCGVCICVLVCVCMCMYLHMYMCVYVFSSVPQPGTSVAEDTAHECVVCGFCG